MKKVDSLCIPLIRELGIQDGVRLAVIRRDWFALFSKPLCYHISPCKLSRGEILLNVDSPVWLQELQYFKHDILKKMASYGVKSVRFRIGKVSKKQTAKKASRESVEKPFTTEDISFMDNVVSQIRDEELKGAVKRALKRSLSARKVKR